MLVYRARLAEQAAAVLSVAVRPRPQAGGLGTVEGLGAVRIIIRYVTPSGAVRVHRGHLHGGERHLTVAGYQVSDGEVLVSLAPGPRPGREGAAVAAPAVVADRFRLPVGLQAWGVQALVGARAHLQAVARARGSAVTVRGTLRLQLDTPGAPFHLRIPFCRVVGLDGPLPPGPGLRWQVLSGVTGLHLRVEPGGWVTGEAVVALRCEGVPAAPTAAAPLSGQPQLQAVRELSGRVARAAAELASGDGDALVRGAVELDLYWFDREGRSRWSGRSLPFSGMVALAGAAPGDRLETQARVERLSHRVVGGQVVVFAVAGVAVAALRPLTVRLGADLYRLDRVVATAATMLELEAPMWESPEAQPCVSDRGGAVQEAWLPLPGPAGGWEEVAAVLSTPEAGAGGRWRVRAAVGGTPLGEPPYPAPLRAAAAGVAPVGARAVVAAVPGLVAVSAAGVAVRTSLTWAPPHAGPAGPGPAPDGGGQEFGYIALPAPVRTVLAATAVPLPVEGLRITALAATEPRGLVLVEGLLPWAGGMPSRLTAVPMLHDGVWQLHVRVTRANG